MLSFQAISNVINKNLFTNCTCTCTQGQGKGPTSCFLPQAPIIHNLTLIILQKISDKVTSTFKALTFSAY